jgi:hypothetical protein
MCNSPFRWLFFVWFLILRSTVVFAADAGAEPKEKGGKKSGTPAFELNKKDPIYITSDWMEVDQIKNTITYKGRVVTVQADMTMRSETLIAYYDAGMKQMNQIVLEGKVNAVQGNRMATGEKAVFDDKSNSDAHRQPGHAPREQPSDRHKVVTLEQDRRWLKGMVKSESRPRSFPKDLQSQGQRDGAGKQK